MTERRLEHRRDQLVVVEVIADDHHGSCDRTKHLVGLTCRAIDHDQQRASRIVGDALAVLDRNTGGGQRRLDQSAQAAITGHADRAPRIMPRHVNTSRKTQ